MALNFPTDEVFLTTEEVLEYLQVNLRTVYRLIKAGKIPAVRVGRQWRFRKRDIDAWLDSQRARGGTRVIVRHSDLPSSHVKKYERGWTEHYLKALARYFAKGAKQRTPAARAPESSWGRKAERPARHPQKAPARKAAPGKTTRKAAARKPARKPVRKTRPAPRRKASARRSRR